MWKHSLNCYLSKSMKITIIRDTDLRIQNRKISLWLISSQSLLSEQDFTVVAESVATNWMIEKELDDYDEETMLVAPLKQQ